jgi:hypothetical protein
MTFVSASTLPYSSKKRCKYHTSDGILYLTAKTAHFSRLHLDQNHLKKSRSLSANQCYHRYNQFIVCKGGVLLLYEKNEHGASSFTVVCLLPYTSSLVNAAESSPLASSTPPRPLLSDCTTMLYSKASEDASDDADIA